MSRRFDGARKLRSRFETVFRPLFQGSEDSGAKRFRQRGIKLKTVSIVHQFSAAPGSTFTEWGRLASCTYANNTAITCGENLVASPTMPSASDPEPQVTTATLTTAAYIASQVDLNLEFGVEIPQGGNGIYNLYGVFVTFNRLDH